MNNTLKTILTAVVISAVVALVVVAVGLRLVGNQSADAQLGAASTRYPNSGLVAQWFAASSTSQNSSFAGTVSITGTSTLQGLVAGTSTLGNLASGNGVLAFNTSTTISSTTLTAAQFCGYGAVRVHATNNTTSTIALPAATSTQAQCLASDGASKSILIFTTTSSAHTVTIASSTAWQTAAGMTYLKAFNVSTTFTLLGDEAVRLTITQTSSTGSYAIVERMSRQ